MSGVREGWVRGQPPPAALQVLRVKVRGAGGGGADAIDSASAAHARADTTRLQTDGQIYLQLATYENRKWTSSQLWNYIFSLVINKKYCIELMFRTRVRLGLDFSE